MSDEAFKPWNVKDFPVELRMRITDAAARARMSVAEWLTAYFQKHGIDGEDLPAIPKREIPANRAAAPDDSALDRAIDRACRLAQHATSMPKSVADLAYGLVREELRALRGGRPDLPRLASGKFARLTGSSDASEAPQQPAALLPSRHEEPRPVNGEATASE